MRPHGVRGALRVKALSSAPNRMFDLETIYLARDSSDKPSYQTFQVERVQRDRGDDWFLYLEGITDREAAEPLRNLYVLVAFEDAVPLEDDEIYLFQVIGLEARTQDGRVLGHVVAVMETGANDVYVVQGDLYGEVLIPAIEQVVQIDTDQGVLWITPMPGLLPE